MPTRSALPQNYLTASGQLPRCLISFDDGYLSAFEQGYSYMQATGLKGTFYIAPVLIGTAGYVTLDQLTQMYAHGWAIANHSYNHVDLSGRTQSYVENELTLCKNWLIANGYPRAAYHVAYPDGAYDAATLAAMSATVMLTGRLTSGAAANPPLADNRLMTSTHLNSSLTLDQAKAAIDNALSLKQTISLHCHQLESSASATAWAIVDFLDLVDYLVARKAPCVTIDEWYNGLTNPRYQSAITAQDPSILSLSPLIYRGYYETEGRLFAVRSDKKELYVSVDNGLTWTAAYYYAANSFEQAIYYPPLGDYIIIWNGGARIGRLKKDYSTIVAWTDAYRRPPINAYLGCCQKADGTIFVCEYDSGGTYRKISKSSDYGASWTLVLDGGALSPAIRHWHSLQMDPYTGYLWACSGDTSDASRIMVSANDGGDWTTLETGSQAARCIGLAFFENYVVWATDSPSVQSKVYRSDKANWSKVEIGNISGPAYGLSKLSDGRVLIYTYIEPGAGADQNLMNLYMLDTDFTLRKIYTARKSVSDSYAGWQQMSGIGDNLEIFGTFGGSRSTEGLTMTVGIQLV